MRTTYTVAEAEAIVERVEQYKEQIEEHFDKKCADPSAVDIAIWLAYWDGLTAEEICGLLWTDIDYVRAIITISGRPVGEMTWEASPWTVQAIGFAREKEIEAYGTELHPYITDMKPNVLEASVILTLDYFGMKGLTLQDLRACHDIREGYADVV